MPLCSESNKEEWRKKGHREANATDDCYYDRAKRKIVCGGNSGCSGFGEVKDEVRGVTEKYDCRECDFRASLFSKKNKVLRIGCCNVCLNRKKMVGIKTDGERINMVICKGCANDELETILEDNKEICKRDDKGRFKCDTDLKACEVGSLKIDDKKTVCHVSPCGECPDGSVSRAQCCAQCLEQTCESWDFGQEVKQVCTGCGDGDFPNDDVSPLNPGSTGFWIFILVAVLVIAAAGAGFYAYNTRNPAVLGGGQGLQHGLPPSNPAVGRFGPPPSQTGGWAAPPSQTGGWGPTPPQSAGGYGRPSPYTSAGAPPPQYTAHVEMSYR